jgi:hypothetical protein
MLRDSSDRHSGITKCNLLGYVAVFCLPTLIVNVADSSEKSANIYKLLTYPSDAVDSSETSVLVYQFCDAGNSLAPSDGTTTRLHDVTLQTIVKFSARYGLSTSPLPHTIFCPELKESSGRERTRVK